MVFDAIKNDNSFTSPATAAKKRRFKTNFARNTQVIVPNLNEKSTEESTSDEDSADKSDEEAFQELAEEESRQREASKRLPIKDALGDEAVPLK